MHECPECGMVCDCDCEDTWWNEPLPFECYHECGEIGDYDDDYIGEWD